MRMICGTAISAKSHHVCLHLMCVCTYIYIHTYTHTHICMYIYVYTHTHTNLNSPKHIYMYLFTINSHIMHTQAYIHVLYWRSSSALQTYTHRNTARQASFAPKMHQRMRTLDNKILFLLHVWESHWWCLFIFSLDGCMLVSMCGFLTCIPTASMNSWSLML